MNANQALELFLSKALMKNKRLRYLGFIAKPKAQFKFLESIYHELEECFDESKKVNLFPESILLMPGYKFEPPNNFGQSISSIIEVCNSVDESFLVITTDGKYGIHGPGTFIDDRAFYAI